jgi:hypothetical protein
MLLRSGIRVVFGTLLALPALAQFQSVAAPGGNDNAGAVPGDPYFALYSDLPSPLPDVVAGFVNVNRAARLASMGHRYFFDASAHIYFGYDLVVQPQETIDTYRVIFSNLSLAPFDLPSDSPDTLDRSLWTLVPLPAMPAAQNVTAGDRLSIRVFHDDASGRELFDSLNIGPMPHMPVRDRYNGIEWWQWAHTTLRNGNALPYRKSATVFGDVRAFSIDDAEMRLQMGRLTINGQAERGFDGSNAVMGPLVWFYAPGHGRYILSLAPRPDLGFAKAGELRGGLAAFKVDRDDVLLESPAMIAPGDAPYSLYVLHDAGWVPTARTQGARVVFGSVSPRELEAMR